MATVPRVFGRTLNRLRCLGYWEFRYSMICRVREKDHDPGLPKLDALLRHRYWRRDAKREHHTPFSHPADRESHTPSSYAGVRTATA